MPKLKIFVTIKYTACVRLSSHQTHCKCFVSQGPNHESAYTHDEDNCDLFNNLGSAELLPVNSSSVKTFVTIKYTVCLFYFTPNPLEMFSKLSLSHMMLSLMRFHFTVEIAACGMSSNISSAGQKHITEYYNMFCIKNLKLIFVFGSCSVSAKEQPVDTTWHLRRFEKVSSKVKQNGGLFDSQSLLFFHLTCYENSKLIVTAVGRNSLSSLSEHGSVSVTTQDTILSIPGKVRVKETAIDICQSSAKRGASTVWLLHALCNLLI